MTPGRITRALLAICVVTAGELRAQCPDGSPPPCRSAATPTTKRVVNPPVDDKTWIVVPFDNLAKTPDADWLRGAAVNLLYLDMSRWKDIHVIDDERVGDILREVPEVKADQPLSLGAGVAVAKRAGAGRLVMGDVLKLGNRTTVTAKIFDVKTGQRLRSVRDETAIADSVMPMFTRLARKILEIAPPQGANLGAFGTTRMDAYHEYMSGVDALSRYDLATAHTAFDNAVRLDSTFALAHYKQSIVIGWENPADPSRRLHADAANRLAAGLPPRERTLIAGQLQQTNGEWTKACETYGSLVKGDSSDVEAWYGLGECFFHDPTLEVIDSAHVRFRADYQRSIRAFDRVLQLDPTYHLAYQHILDALTPERHPPSCMQGNRCYTAFLIRAGDTLVVEPVNMLTDTAKLRQQAETFVRTASRRGNLRLAQIYAEAWVQSSPNEPQAHRGLARVKNLQGHPDEADAEQAKVKAKGTLAEELRGTLERMDNAYKIGKGAIALALYDSARSSSALLPGATFSFGNALAGYGPAFGRVAEFDSLMNIGLKFSNASDSISRYAHQLMRGILTGALPDSTIALEAANIQSARGRPILQVGRNPWPNYSATLRARRTIWPPVDTTIRDLRSIPALALASGDTAKLRRAAQALDSIAHAVSAAGVSDSGFSLLAAEAYLALHDSSAALASLRFQFDVGMPTTSYFPQSSGQLPPVFYAPRGMLLRADLAAAAKQTDEARTWYKRFIDVWNKADPEFQPIVDRARKSLAALGGVTP